ncbi:hypothetical protein RB653_004140 [Dictyostelium firmibasis]|uniref:Follistatin-like domain-containing protein n=1 Tax=Dictyostelium firmibasis TaxID=79012 RepID=A0AAN7UA23_9MYCE
MKLLLIAIIFVFGFFANATEEHRGSCRGFGCPEGNHCEVVGGYPVCVRDTQTCKGHRCPTGFECTMEYGEPHCIRSSHSQCDNTACPHDYSCKKINSTIISCISNDDSCSTVLCPAGTHCFSRLDRPKCYTEDEYPQLCRFTRCPTNHYCEMNGQNIDCIQGGIVPPTETPVYCITCAQLPCEHVGLACVTVPSVCTTTNCCNTRPMCVAPTSTTSSATTA